MRIWKVITTAVAVAVLGCLVAPLSAQAAPYCGITWGSLEKTGTGTPLPGAGPVINVRAGQHDCYDRLVIDLGGPASGYTAKYGPVTQQGSGNPVPLRGGATIELVLHTTAYDPNTGAATYSPSNPAELVNVAGWRTLRQVAWGGSFEGQTTIGIGVRARLPFRVFTLTGPGTQSRLVLDVAHQW